MEKGERKEKIRTARAIPATLLSFKGTMYLKKLWRYFCRRAVGILAYDTLL